MDFSDYQLLACKTRQYPDANHNMIYPALGLAGEAGEVVDKIKKVWRNYGATNSITIHWEDKEEIIKELGDVLWYIAALCDELNIDMSYMASINLEKLADRQKRGVIKSEGDNR